MDYRKLSQSQRKLLLKISTLGPVSGVAGDFVCIGDKRVARRTTISSLAENGLVERADAGWCLTHEAKKVVAILQGRLVP